MDGAQSTVELERQRDEYRSKANEYQSRAMHWRTECDNRDKKIHELEQFLRSLISRIQERVDHE